MTVYTNVVEPATQRQREFLARLEEQTGKKAEHDGSLQGVSAAIDRLLKARSANPLEFTATNLPRRGTYTVVGPKGGHRTLKFVESPADENDSEPKVFVNYLDHTNNYTGFAIIRNGAVRIFSRLSDRTDLIAALKFLARDRDNVAEAGRAYAVESGNCYVCGHELTNPESIAAGIGPVCAQKGGY
jgi:hypothetical protein